MYKFNYQYLLHEGKPIFTCIVPGGWLLLDLPIFGGDVIYLDKRVKAEMITDFTFEFSEIPDALSSGRTFTLKVDIHRPLLAEPTLGDYRELLNKIIRIRYQCGANKSTNENLPVEIVLLNHWLCGCAGSAYTGVSFLDFGDLLVWLSRQSELILDFETGSDPKVMIQNILDRLGDTRIASSYSNIFGKDVNMYLAHLEIVAEKLCCSLVYAPAVDQEGFLISTLIPDKDFELWD